MAPNAPESKVESVKRASRGLRGSIAGGLATPSSHFDGGDPQLLKFHGIYQGVDRDTATERKQSGVEKDYEFMIRAKIPGGRLTPAQYLALDDLAGLYGNGHMRVTTRQGIQRSEEHTSELQSRWIISYAVFCLDRKSVV